MCQKSPGPRCANHLRKAMDAVREQIAENKAAFVNGTEPPHRGAEGRLAQLQDEYDETRTGQADLAGQINALENAEDPDTWEIDRVRSRMLNAADRRAAKLAALKSTEAGNPRAAKYQLRYGAHAGWLAESDLPETTKDTGGLTVYRDYAIGTTFHDLHDEQVGYEERAEYLTVMDAEVVYEAPVTPGSTPGTWVVGGAEALKNAEGGRLLRTVEAHGPNQAHRTVTPVVFNEATGTVAPVDLRTGQPIGEPVALTDARALTTLDYNDGLDLGTDFAENADQFAAKMAVRTTAEGRHVLRGEFEVSTAHAYAQRRYA